MFVDCRLEWPDHDRLIWKTHLYRRLGYRGELGIELMIRTINHQVLPNLKSWEGSIHLRAHRHDSKLDLGLEKAFLWTERKRKDYREHAQMKSYFIMVYIAIILEFSSDKESDALMSFFAKFTSSRYRHGLFEPQFQTTRLFLQHHKNSDSCCFDADHMITRKIWTHHSHLLQWSMLS